MSPVNYSIIPSIDFERNFKRLFKKCRSLKQDFTDLKKRLLENPEIGDDLGNDIRKVRMAIASKSKGKSGGARVITYNVLVSMEDTDIYLLTIYDKGERKSISKKEIEELKRESGL
jgi:hypothetical protein